MTRGRGSAAARASRIVLNGEYRRHPRSSCQPPDNDSFMNSHHSRRRQLLTDHGPDW